jgi:hypothetical protein
VRLLQIVVRRRQRPVPLQKRGLHPIDCGGTLCGLSALVQERILHGPQPVLQSVVVRSQGLHEGVEGVVLPRYQLGEAVVSRSHSALQLLQAVVRNTKEKSNTEHSNKKKTRNKPRVE